MTEMIKTVKLYDDAPYERRFSARIADLKPADDGSVLLLTDRTLFFPEEGGQTCDKGTLGGFDVLHVSISDGYVFHKVKCDPAALRVGDEIAGVIDWSHRFSNMQNHSAEHILSGLLHTKWDSENKGFHLSDNIVTLDTSSELKETDIKKLEREANEVIFSNIPVTCRYYDPEELKGVEYRSKIELYDDVRLVTIPGVDVCACCAPHVSHTGEIGIVKIIKAIRYKGGMRLTFLAGGRAYEYISLLQDMSEKISYLLSESPDKLDAAVSRLLKENEEYRIRIKNEAAAKLEKEIEAFPEDSEDAVLFTGIIDNTVQRRAVNSLAEKHKGICAVFASDGAGGYNYILSYPEGDAREISKLINNKLPAKGGGSAEMVQGNIKASDSEILGALNLSLDFAPR